MIAYRMIDRSSGGRSDWHPPVPAPLSPGRSLLIHGRTPTTKSTYCDTGGSGRWARSRSARRRPTWRDAVPRKPCHHQGVPIASHLVPVPGVDRALVAVVPHGHPTGPSRVGHRRVDDHATTLGERSSEGVRVSAHATSRHEGQCATYSNRRSRVGRTPREARRCQRIREQSYCGQVRRPANRAEAAEAGSLRLGSGLALLGRAKPEATGLTPPTTIARSLANRAGEGPGDRCGSR